MESFFGLPHLNGILMAAEACLKLPEESQVPSKKRNRIRNRQYGLDEVDSLSDIEFSKMFRISREGLQELYILIEPRMANYNEHMAKVSSGSSITKKTKLYAALRYLAGASYLDICFEFGISKTSFYSDLWLTLQAIDLTFNITLPLDDNDALLAMSTEFAHYSIGKLLGCVTAIDGWVAQTRRPHASEVGDIMAFRNRHDCW